MKEKKKLTIGGIFSQIILLILAVIVLSKVYMGVYRQRKEERAKQMEKEQKEELGYGDR